MFCEESSHKGRLEPLGVRRWDSVGHLTLDEATGLSAKKNTFRFSCSGKVVEPTLDDSTDDDSIANGDGS